MAALADRLIDLAGYNDRAIAAGGKYAVEFKQILAALQYIGDRKVDDYGDFRLQDIQSWDRETWGAYWDILRKFGRLNTQLHTARAAFKDPSSDPPSIHPIVNQLMETLSDQAVYCVRMIQILKRLEEKGLVPVV